MQTQKKKYISPEEYLETERKAEFKSEYYNGEMFLPTGASVKHNRISTNLTALLHNQLRHKPCSVFHSDLRVKSEKSEFYTYPDIIVVCGEPKFEEKSHMDTVLNPVIIIEILSEPTKDYDRGQKFEFYRLIPELIDYILVAQDKIHIEHFTKLRENEWLLKEFSGFTDNIQIESIKYLLSVNEIYEKIEFVR